ncbi:MAG: AsmA family protein [Alphaproteobacteria bacterium]|nr:AsmA family protein [Alphaproteobacteria bacterium]
MRLRTILLSLLAVIVLAVGGAFAALMSIDFSKYRGTIEQKVAQATGRQFKIGSEFQIKLGLSPSLVANDVTFANASWGSRPQMVVVKQFEVQINLLPLVFGTISVAHLKLIDADILLETDAKGVGNWDFLQSAAQAAAPSAAPPKPSSGSEIHLPEIHDLYIEGVLLQFHDGQTKETRRFSLGHLALSADNPGAPLKIDINGTYNDFYAEIGGSLSSLASLGSRSTPHPLDITAKLGATDTVLRIQGNFAQPLEARGYDLRVTAGTNEMAQFADFARDAHFGAFPLPKIGPLKADLHILDAGPANATTGGVPSLAEAQIDAGRADLLRLQVGGAVRELIQLKGIGLDVTASGQEIGALSGLVLPGVPNGLPQFPPLGPYRLALKLADGPDRVALPSVRLDLGREAGLKLAVSGAIQDPLAGKGYALTLEGQAQDLAVVADEFQLGLPLTGPLSVSGKIADTGPQRYALTGLAVTAEGSDIGGNGTLSLAGAKPAASAELSSTMIDLGKIMPSLKANGAPNGGRSAPRPKAESDGRVFPADPLPLALLNAIDADLRYQAAAIRTPGGPEFHDTALQVGLQGGALSAQPLTSAIGNGQMTGALSLDSKSGVAAVKLAFKNVSLDEIDHEVPGEDLVDGAITNADLDVKGAGSSVRAIMGNLNGTVFLGIGPGTFKARYTDMLGLGGLTDVVGKSLPKIERTTLHCLVTRFDVSNGLATSRVLLADTGRLTLDGSGTINLKSEELDIGLDTHTKVTNLLSLMPPIHVGGTLAHPDFEPDVGAAAVGLVGNVIDDILRQPGNVISSLFGGDQTPPEQKICNAAYAKAERSAAAVPAGKATAPPVAQPAPAPAPAQKKPSSDPIQDLGQGIQRNLRGLFGK